MAIGQASGDSSSTVTLQPLADTRSSSTVEKEVTMSLTSYQQDQVMEREQEDVEENIIGEEELPKIQKYNLSYMNMRYITCDTITWQS